MCTENGDCLRGTRMWKEIPDLGDTLVQTCFQARDFSF